MSKPKYIRQALWPAGDDLPLFRVKPEEPPPMTFYHNTSAENATAIQAQGFRDGQDIALGYGVWFTDDPDYMAHEVALTLEIPAEVMHPYWLEYEEGETAREWFVPAAIVNTYLHTLKVQE